MTLPQGDRPMQGFPQLIAAMTQCVGAMAEALCIALEFSEKRKALREKTAAALKEHFQRIYPESKYHSTGIDPHLAIALHRDARGHYGRNLDHPRLVDLVLLHLGEAIDQAEERRVSAGNLLVPSPVYLAVEALTIPKRLIAELMLYSPPEPCWLAGLMFGQEIHLSATDTKTLMV